MTTTPQDALKIAAENLLAYIGYHGAIVSHHALVDALASAVDSTAEQEDPQRMTNDQRRAASDAVMAAEQEVVPDVDWLAQVIRAADGNHTLGAGALAEKIVEAMTAAAPKHAAALQALSDQAQEMGMYDAGNPMVKQGNVEFSGGRENG